MELTDKLRKIGPWDQWLINSSGDIVGVRNPNMKGKDLYGLRFDASGNMIAPDSSLLSLTSVWPVVNLTATGSLAAAACEFGGFVVRSQSGGTADVTIYDALSATGVAIMTVPNVVEGTYYWDGDWVTPGVGRGNARANTVGGWAVIAGTANIDFLVR